MTEGPATICMRESVAYPLYLAAYKLMEEVEPFIQLKGILNVLHDHHSHPYSFRVSLFDWELSQFLNSVEKLNAESRVISETYGFNPVTREDELSRRHDIESVEQATAKFREMLESDPDAYAHNLLVLERKAEKWLKLLIDRGSAVRDRVYDLTEALERDLRLVQSAHKTPVDPKDSMIANLVSIARSLLEPGHLPEVLYLCKEAINTVLALPGPESLDKLSHPVA